MKNRILGLCSYIISCCAILILLITSIDTNAFQKDFYESTYSSLQTAQSLEMSHVDLMKATTTLLDYIQDDRDDIVAEITIREIPRPAFNERETLHMVDVKGLYEWALQVRVLCIVLLLGCLAYLIWQKRKESLEYLATAFIQISFVFAGIIAMLGCWAMVDFTSLWENFHHVFFTNDLWILNPRTDLMINMFPEEFFFQMVQRIAGMFVIVFGAMLGGSVWFVQRRNHSLYSWRKGR